MTLKKIAIEAAWFAVLAPIGICAILLTAYGLGQLLRFTGIIL